MSWRLGLGLCLAVCAARADGAPPESVVKAAAQGTNGETEPRNPSGWIAVPVAGFTPETSVQLGGLVIYFFQLSEDSSLSSFPVLGIGTFKEQFLVEIRPELFFDRDNYRLWTRFDLQRFPDSFFGVGNDVREENKERYQREFTRVRTNMRRRIVGDLHAGILSDHVNMALSYEKDDGLFATREYAGERGGLTAGFGPTVAYDTRNHKNYPTQGLLIEASVMPFIGFLGSDYNYWQGALDGRAYFSLGHQQLLAFQYYLEATDGDVPFYMLPQLGGPDLVRGYFRGKYRDESLHALQAEYRAHLIWKIRAAAFASIGQVGANYAAMWSSTLRSSIGGGVRYNMKSADDIVNLRVDVGWVPTTGEAGLYVAAAEAF